MEKKIGITYPSQTFDCVEKRKLPFHTKIRRLYSCGENTPAAGAHATILTKSRTKKIFPNCTKNNISFIDNYCYSDDNRNYLSLGFGSIDPNIKSLRHFPEKRVSVVENDCIVDNPSGIYINHTKNTKRGLGKHITNIKLENLVNGIFRSPKDHVFTKKFSSKDKSYLKFHDLSCILANAYYNDLPTIEKKKENYVSSQSHRIFLKEKFKSKPNPVFSQYSLEANGSFIVPKSSSLTLDEKRKAFNRCNWNTTSHLNSALLPPRSTHDMWLDHRPSKSFFHQTPVSMMYKNTKTPSEHRGVRFFHEKKNCEANK